MKTVFDENGTPTKLDAVDANQRIAAGIAFAHNPLLGDPTESEDLDDEPPVTEKQGVMAELDGLGVEYNPRSQLKTLQAALDAKKLELDAE